MTEHILVGIASIVVLGVTAQWLAWRLHLPSILIMLLFGFIAGPVTGLLHPDEILGDLFFPFVSIAVALILFEGGLSLKIAELQKTFSVIRNLIVIGVIVTWILTATMAYFILDFPLPISVLFGAILVVTGPTVIIPLLRQIRATSRISSIVKWEGIVNDPIGALLAVLVFEAILISGFQATSLAIVSGIGLTILNGIVLGVLSALLLVYLLKRYWIPGYLQNAVTLMIVIAAFTASNLVQAESGLFTVTIIGVILANQKRVSIKPIVDFKEHLSVFLLSVLFIVLAARLQPEDLARLDWHSLAFLAVLVLLIRPVAVFLSTLNSDLSWKEKTFLAWMAPRGIVAAAITAVFALELSENTIYEQAEIMVPEMFFVIICTVAIYGLSATPLGRWLGVAQPNPQGVLFVGAHAWARKLAAVLKDQKFKVLLVDTNRENISAARLEGLPTAYASALSEYIQDEIDLGGIGRLAALTPNDEVNSLAALHFAEVFDRAEVYQLAPKETDNKRKEVSMPLRGRFLFGKGATYPELDRRFKAGSTIKVTTLTDQFSFNTFQELYNGQVLPLFLISKTGDLRVFTAANGPKPQAGDVLISMVDSSQEASVEGVSAVGSPESRSSAKNRFSQILS